MFPVGNLASSVSNSDDVKVRSILQRHSPSVALPNRMFVVSEGAAGEPRQTKVQFHVLYGKKELNRDLDQEETLIVEKNADALRVARHFYVAMPMQDWTPVAGCLAQHAGLVWTVSKLATLSAVLLDDRVT